MDSLITVDPAALDSVLSVFGVPVGWLLATIPSVVMLVNTVKALIPNVRLDKSWFYPVVGLGASAFYAWKTLQPDVTAIVVGTIAVFATQWLSWVLAKITAQKVGLRDK